MYKGPQLGWHWAFGSFNGCDKKIWSQLVKHSQLSEIAKYSKLYKRYLLVKEFKILDIDIKRLIGMVMIGL
jgi:hypothetical protein